MADDDKGYKCFRFEINLSVKGYGYVYAKTEDETEELIERKQWEELDNMEIEVVEEITDINEVEE